MPYFMQQEGEKWCVVKGTKDSPGETMHCYSGDDAKSKARKYLAALYVNVEDVAQTKEFQAVLSALKEVLLQKDAEELLIPPIYGKLYTYKESTDDRWIAVSSIAKNDRTGEIFTKEAMDWDIARAYRTGRFPELRAFHVRGFKLGVCDSMQRIGDYAVDQGYWLNTPFAQATKEVVNSSASTRKNGISRGFYSVEATGLCRECGAGLMVGLANYITGVTCKECSTHIAPSGIKNLQLRHLKTVTFDLSLTDVPAVPGTAIASYKVQNLE